MTVKKRAANRRENPYRTTTSLDDLGPADRIAYELVAERRDLLPSVERIMNAGLADDAALRAMTLFRDSLTDIGDPHRDPRVAIANSGATAPKPVESAQ